MTRTFANPRARRVRPVRKWHAVFALLNVLSPSDRRAMLSMATRLSGARADEERLSVDLTRAVERTQVLRRAAEKLAQRIIVDAPSRKRKGATS